MWNIIAEFAILVYNALRNWSMHEKVLPGKVEQHLKERATEMELGSTSDLCPNVDESLMLE